MISSISTHIFFLQEFLLVVLLVLKLPPTKAITYHIILVNNQTVFCLKNSLEWANTKTQGFYWDLLLIPSFGKKRAVHIISQFLISRSFCNKWLSSGISQKSVWRQIWARSFLRKYTPSSTNSKEYCYHNKKLNVLDSSFIKIYDFLHIMFLVDWFEEDFILATRLLNSNANITQCLDSSKMPLSIS